MASKYKNKPEQLRPLSGVNLYEDMQWEELNRAGEKRKMDYLAFRPPKKQKTDPEETNQINEKQQKLLDDWLEFLKTSQEELETREADIIDLGMFIPPVTIKTLEDAKLMVQTLQELCVGLKLNGKSEDFLCCLENMCDLKTERKQLP